MKRTYHPDYAILARVKELSNDELKNIPKSTLHSWKNRDFTKIVGSEFFISDEKIDFIKAFISNQTLLNAAKGLYFIYNAWVSIANNVRGMKTQLRKNREIIVKTIDDVSPLIGLKRACKFFKITQYQFYTWKKKVNCLLSPLDKCHKQNPLNIAPSELKTIKNFVQNSDYKDYPLASIFYEMERQGKAFMSQTSFYKYAKYFDNETNRKKIKPKQKTGIRAAKPKEIIQADVCVYRPLDYTKVFIYFIIDNFSRMILGWKISTQYRSSVMLENLRHVYCKYLLGEENPLSVLLVDDGIENKGDVNVAIAKQEINVHKLIAQKDIVFSNSMIEAINKRMKYDFLYRHELLDFNHVERFLETAVEIYNNRPHTALFGLTPYEVFHGKIPDKNIFKSQQEQAKLLRIAENKALACNNCAFMIENNN
jgi:hypothetical protein